MTTLVTGFAGGLARAVAERLLAAGETVVGVDYRPVDGVPPGVTSYRASYHKTAIEDVFRRHAFDTVLHLGRVGNLAENVETRFDLNVVGMQKMIRMSAETGVRTLVVLSTFHIYGAHPRNPARISEQDPLRAGHEFPEIADAIQLDHLASSFARDERPRVVVLRPTNVVGPRVRNTMSRFLRLPRVPHLIGFNPMMQFIHERDLASAVGVAATDARARGVFNVAGGSAVPWRTALELAGAPTIPVPAGLAQLYLRAFTQLPAYLVRFYKYPCIISDERFRAATGWRPEIDARETLRSARAA